MTAKQLLQKDTDLRNFWAAVAHQDQFERVLVYAMTALTEQTLTTEHLDGAKRLREVLLTIADEETALPTMPGSGLKHFLDSPLPTKD